MPNHNDVTCVCSILPFVNGLVLLGDWNLTKPNLDKLQRAFNGHQNSVNSLYCLMRKFWNFFLRRFVLMRVCVCVCVRVCVCVCMCGVLCAPIKEVVATT